MQAPEVKTALVIGGGSGMGRVSAEILAARGIEVLVADLDQAAARETAGLITRTSGQALGYGVDVADSRSVADLFQLLDSEDKSADLLVQAAAIMGKTAFYEDIKDDDWRKVMAINLDGSFFCGREAVRRMKKSGGGRIIFFSSVASLTPSPGAIPYSAAKGAINMMTKSLAHEAARHNIRVNAIAPGYIETPMLDGLPDGFADHIIRKTPIKRLGRPEEIASLVAYLASPEADFITGQILSPNGGLVM